MVMVLETVTVAHWLPLKEGVTVALPHGDAVTQALAVLHTEGVEEMVMVKDRVLVLVAVGELEVVTLEVVQWEMLRVKEMVGVLLVHWLGLKVRVVLALRHADPEKVALPVKHDVGLTERELVGDWEGEVVTELDTLPLRDTEMLLVTLNVREVVTVEEEEMVPLRDWLGDAVKEVEAVLLADTQVVKDALRLLEGEAL